MGRDLLQNLNFSLPTTLVYQTLSQCTTYPSPSLPPIFDPIVWDTSNPTCTTHTTPVLICLRDLSIFYCIPQYPVAPKCQWVPKPIINSLLDNGFLEPTYSLYNTLILLLLKPNASYHLVRKLRITNDYHNLPSGAKPLNYILSYFSLYHFTVLNLKYAFFTIPLQPECQDFFSLMWTDQDTLRSQQLTWTVLAQGFKESLHFFNKVLDVDLTCFDLKPSTFLEYVDNLLLCSPTPTLAIQSIQPLFSIFFPTMGATFPLIKAK